ncbi:MAG: PDGLE domain-containing protein [Syntrophomonadaceae bacterium]|nr:PDGLE domain-containing protein [Syntrophomonadaceae bacterium]
MGAYRKLWTALVVMIVLSPLGLLAGGTAFGEWGAEELFKELGYVPAGLARLADIWTQRVLLPDYTVPGLENGVGPAVGYVLSALVGASLVALLLLLFSRVVREE